jgi:hypothetical protein
LISEAVAPGLNARTSNAWLVNKGPSDFFDLGLFENRDSQPATLFNA